MLFGICIHNEKYVKYPQCTIDFYCNIKIQQYSKGHTQAAINRQSKIIDVSIMIPLTHCVYSGHKIM